MTLVELEYTRLMDGPPGSKLWEDTVYELSLRFIREHNEVPGNTILLGAKERLTVRSPYKNVRGK